MTVRTYRPRQLEVQAVLWDGSEKALDEISSLMCSTHTHIEAGGPLNGTTMTDLAIVTSYEEANYRTPVSLGDYVVCNAQGELYSYSSDEFARTYEVVQ